MGANTATRMADGSDPLSATGDSEVVLYTRSGDRSVAGEGSTSHGTEPADDERPSGEEHDVEGEIQVVCHCRTFGDKGVVCLPEHTFRQVLKNLRFRILEDRVADSLDETDRSRKILIGFRINGRTVNLSQTLRSAGFIPFAPEES